MLRRNNYNKRLSRINERLTSVMKTRRKLLERVRATNDHTVDAYNTGRNFYSINDVIETENLTSEVFKTLRNKKECNVKYTVELEEFGRYRDENSKVTNAIEITKLSDSYRPTSFLQFEVSEGLITIYDQNETKLLREQNQKYVLKWFYDDLNQSDIKDIANYLYDKVLTWTADPITKKQNISKNELESLLKNAIEKECSNSLTALLPRGRQRSHVYSVSDRYESVVYFEYRENSTRPYTEFCSFHIIGNDDDSCDVICLDVNKEEVASTTLYNDVDLSFVKSCVIECFDKYLSK